MLALKGLYPFKYAMLPTSLDDPVLQTVLQRLHAHDRKHLGNFVRAIMPFIFDGLLRRRPSPALQAERIRKVAFGLTPAAGRLAYLIARAIQARRIVEFGTSFGISTLYLAAAVRDNGGGVVIGSELEPSKVSEARRNVAEAGLTDFVDIRAGDARETLANPGGVIDMVLLDGSKELYLPVLHALEQHLRPGAVVLADNVLMFRKSLAPYRAYVRDKANAFQSVTLTVGSGLGYSVRL
jgi:predicted O-methyltransferase YrrM